MDTIDDMPAYLHDEIRNFFEEYKKLEHKTVLVDGFQPKETAKLIIQEAIADYQAMLKK